MLRWLERYSVPTPPVLHFEPDEGRLGRAAIVMARMPGDALGRADQATRDRLGADLGRHLARLHAIDVADFDGGISDDVLAATSGQLAFWAGRYRSDALMSVPLLGGLLAWLERNQPERAGLPVLVWGDPGLYNILHQDGDVTALLDRIQRRVLWLAMQQIHYANRVRPHTDALKEAVPSTFPAMK